MKKLTDKHFDMLEKAMNIKFRFRYINQKMSNGVNYLESPHYHNGIKYYIELTKGKLIMKEIDTNTDGIKTFEHQVVKNKNRDVHNYIGHNYKAEFKENDTEVMNTLNKIFEELYKGELKNG